MAKKVDGRATNRVEIHRCDAAVIRIDRIILFQASHIWITGELAIARKLIVVIAAWEVFVFETRSLL